MKHLLLSITVLFALMAKAQELPSNQGPPSDCVTDLIITDYYFPQTSKAGQPINFTLTIKSTNNECMIPAHKAVVYYSNSSGTSWQHIDVNVPTINYQTPDEECDLDYIPNKARKQEVKAVLSNSLGFGGHNATIIFKKYEA